ncbi:hypothetical protein GIB67_027775 [Kingdonia uniflora]|uniref:Cullin family profile domain-containing protein n=1 Tax=Kingdonia uniflora TaxID=39325 RepID=A0A7J7PBZ8_9MAGN|nr:hypothetical protein GIB67_027775 [Kingdonia uniflora]
MLVLQLSQHMHSPTYAIVKKHFVDPEDLVSQKIVTQKNSARGVHFRRTGPHEKVYFKSDDVRACIVTCGSLCPGTNTVIREIVCGLNYMYGVDDVLGIEGGYKGFYYRNTITLTPKSVNDIHKRGDALVLSKKEGSGLMYLFFEGKDEELSTLSELCKDHFSVKFIADSFMEKAIYYASEVFFTVDISRSSVAELLTRMCDDILKKGNLTRITSSNLMDREYEIFTNEERQTIDKVVMIVSLLSDIDDFIKFFSRELSRRLLKKKNGDPREIYVLEMITEKYGVQATHKMRRMYDE